MILAEDAVDGKMKPGRRVKRVIETSVSVPLIDVARL